MGGSGEDNLKWGRHCVVRVFAKSPAKLLNALLAEDVAFKVIHDLDEVVHPLMEASISDRLWCRSQEEDIFWQIL